MQPGSSAVAPTQMPSLGQVRSRRPGHGITGIPVERDLSMNFAIWVYSPGKAEQISGVASSKPSQQPARERQPHQIAKIMDPNPSER